MKWFQLSVEDILKEFSTDPDAGLTVEVVNERIQEYGPNELPQPETESLLKKFFHQFTDVLILVLIVATIVSFAFGEYLDAIVIMIIVVLNGILGFVQEYKAEKSLEALKKMSAQFAMVIRDDKKQRIAVEELVPGDVVELNAGDKVPADCRIIEGFGLNAQEAILTGESLPVSKTTEAISAEHVALGDQQNMLFKDTIVAKGHGKAVVVATGEDTEVGKISTMLSSQETRQTPLQEELDKVGKKLSIAAGVIIVIVFLVGILSGGDSRRVACGGDDCLKYWRDTDGQTACHCEETACRRNIGGNEYYL